MLCCIIFGGFMKTSTKGIIAAIGFVLSIGVYYFLVQGIEWIWSGVCAKYYCMKTLSLAEFLSIEAALIGVYFVVSSIDDWKKEDQYQTAKKNILKLHAIYKKLKIYNVRLANLEKNISVLYITLDKTKSRKIQHTQLFLRYQSILSELEIKKEIAEADYSITQQSKNLYQQDFNNLIGLAHDYINTIDKKLAKKDEELIIQQNSDIQSIRTEYEAKLRNSSIVDQQTLLVEMAEKCNFYQQNLKQNDIDLILNQEYQKFNKYKKELSDLQHKINNF